MKVSITFDNHCDVAHQQCIAERPIGELIQQHLWANKQTSRGTDYLTGASKTHSELEL